MGNFKKKKSGGRGHISELAIIKQQSQKMLTSIKILFEQPENKSHPPIIENHTVTIYM